MIFSNLLRKKPDFFNVCILKIILKNLDFSICLREFNISEFGDEIFSNPFENRSSNLNTAHHSLLYKTYVLVLYCFYTNKKIQESIDQFSIN